ncbi:DNA-binding protein [Staphylococcus aureus]|nr:DNA-binding protein [Staphylococcus aureus]
MTLPKIGKPATRALNSQGIYTLEAVSQYTKSSLMEMHGGYINIGTSFISAPTTF